MSVISKNIKKAFPSHACLQECFGGSTIANINPEPFPILCTHPTIDNLKLYINYQACPTISTDMCWTEFPGEGSTLEAGIIVQFLWYWQSNDTLWKLLSCLSIKPGHIKFRGTLKWNGQAISKSVICVITVNIWMNRLVLQNVFFHHHNGRNALT